MLNPIPLLSLLLASSSFISVSAQDEQELNTTTAWGPDNYGLGTGPFDMPYDQWNEYLDDPVATGSVPLPLPDFTKPFTEDALTDSNTDAGWSWTIDLAEGLPVEGTDNVTTSVRINLNAPKGTAKDIDDSWQLCLIRWQLKEGTNTSSYFDMRKNDDCSGLLTEECIRDMEEAAVGDGGTWLAGCDCPRTEGIESCKGQGFPLWSTCSSGWIKAKEIRKWQDDKFSNIIAYSGMPHPEGDVLGYNMTGYISWPIMLVWGRDEVDQSSSTSSASSLTSARTVAPISTVTRDVTDPTSSSSSSSSASLSSGTDLPPLPSVSNGRRQNSGQRNSTAKLSCLAVTEAREGSIVPGRPIQEASGAGRVMGISSPVLVVVGLLATYFSTL